MKGLSILSIAATLLLAGPTGCDKSEGNADADKAKVEVKVIAKASNDAPVSAELVEFTGAGDKRGLKIRLYNHGDKTAAGVWLLFRYYDASDKLLKVKPGTPFEKDTDFTSLTGGRYQCKPKQNSTFDVDGRLVAVPADAKRVEVLVSKVSAIAADGKAVEDWWGQDKTTEWPTG